MKPSLMMRPFYKPPVPPPYGGGFPITGNIKKEELPACYATAFLPYLTNISTAPRTADVQLSPLAGYLPLYCFIRGGPCPPVSGFPPADIVQRRGTAESLKNHGPPEGTKTRETEQGRKQNKEGEPRKSLKTAAPQRARREGKKKLKGNSPKPEAPTIR
jgi:hypothetical protein